AGRDAASRSLPTGARAGALTALLGAPFHFAIDMTSMLQVHHYVLTSPFDQAQYARSGFPTIASYLISDNLGGYIIMGMVLYPIGLIGISILSAACGGRGRWAVPDGSAAWPRRGAGTVRGRCPARSSCARRAQPVSGGIRSGQPDKAPFP